MSLYLSNTSESNYDRLIQQVLRMLQLLIQLCLHNQPHLLLPKL
jgi:hypothetical protein